MKITKQKTFGFTLVELMVVVSVIGILSAIVYANFGGARAAARDDVRKTALKEMQLAIELYKAQNGRYPQACGNSTNWVSNDASTYACTGGAPFIQGLEPDFIAELPVDPRAGSNPSSNGYLYRVTADGSAYKLLAHGTVEQKRITSYSDEFVRCPQSFGSSHCGATPSAITYAVYSANPTSHSW